MRIVIAGAGPIGLYLAIMLKRLTVGTDHEVVVLDRRAGTYTRPGIVAKQAVAAIEKGLQLELKGISSANDTGEAIFIRDLEKALYKLATQTFKIKIVNENFISIVGNRVNPTSANLEVDFLFDCTGKPRHVVSYLNQHSETTKLFHNIRIADNPHKTHFIANVAFDSDQLPKLRTLHEKDINATSHALAMANLRDTFNWNSYSEPDLALYPMPEMYNDKKVYYLYYEIPDSLLAEDKSVKAAWLQSLLALKTGYDNIEFTIVDGAMSFIPFPVDPHILKETHARATPDGPIVIPAGDAQIEQDYRMGIAIHFGVLRLNALFSALKVAPNTILFIPQLYEAELAPMLDYQTKILQSEYKSLSDKMISALDRELKFFETALLTAENEAISDKLTKHIATIYHLKAVAELNKAAQFKPIVSPHSKPYKHTIDAYAVAVMKAHDYLDSSSKYLKVVNDEFVMHLAISVKDVGNLYHSINCDREAITCYQKAIAIINSNMNSPDNDKAKLSCLTNIMICINRINQYSDSDTQYANEFMRIMANNEIDKDTLVKMALPAAKIFLRELAHMKLDDPSVIDKASLIQHKIEMLVGVVRMNAHTRDQLLALANLDKQITDHHKEQVVKNPNAVSFEKK